MEKEQIKEYFGKKIYVDGHGESLVYWFSKIQHLKRRTSSFHFIKNRINLL